MRRLKKREFIDKLKKFLDDFLMAILPDEDDEINYLRLFVFSVKDKLVHLYQRCVEAEKGANNVGRNCYCELVEDSGKDNGLDNTGAKGEETTDKA